MPTREAIHRLVDELPEEELATAEALLRELRRGDPVLEALARAPIDTEPTSPEENAESEEAWQEHLRGQSIPADEIKKRLLR